MVYWVQIWKYEMLQIPDMSVDFYTVPISQR